MSQFSLILRKVHVLVNCHCLESTLPSHLSPDSAFCILSAEAGELCLAHGRTHIILWRLSSFFWNTSSHILPLHLGTYMVPSPESNTESLLPRALFSACQQHLLTSLPSLPPSSCFTCSLCSLTCSISQGSPHHLLTAHLLARVAGGRRLQKWWSSERPPLLPVGR